MWKVSARANAHAIQWGHTQWNVMVRLTRDTLFDLHFIYSFENRQPVSDAINAHLLQLLVSQGDKRFTDDSIFCVVDGSQQSCP